MRPRPTSAMTWPWTRAGRARHRALPPAWSGQPRGSAPDPMLMHLRRACGWHAAAGPADDPAVTAVRRSLVAVTAFVGDGHRVRLGPRRAGRPPPRSRSASTGRTSRPRSSTSGAGQHVTFVLRNDDPIDHEWILGDDAVQARHRTGTEPVHGARPSEQTIPAESEVRTTITFDAPGTLQYICHLPGHEAYGMVGTVVIDGSWGLVGPVRRRAGNAGQFGRPGLPRRAAGAPGSVAPSGW